jgi:serine/threonine protein kinase
MDSSRHGSASNRELDQTGNCGTVRFMAPEVHATVDDKSRYSPKADIFSLGLVFYYVFEHKLPSIPGAGTPDQHVVQLVRGRRPQFTKTPKAVREIINRCWATESADRPSADDLIGLLRKLPATWASWSCCGKGSREDELWTDVPTSGSAWNEWSPARVPRKGLGVSPTALDGSGVVIVSSSS